MGICSKKSDLVRKRNDFSRAERLGKSRLFLSLFLARKREQEFRGRQPLKQGDKQAAESGADINGRGRYDRRSDMQRSLSGRQPTGLLLLTVAFPRKSERTNEQFRFFLPLNCGVSSTFLLTKKCRLGENSPYELLYFSYGKTEKFL